MTAFGDIPSGYATTITVDNGWVQQLTQQDTVAAALEDIPGLSFSLTLPAAGRITADLNVTTSKNGGGTTVGGWAISINAADGADFQRTMANNSELGALPVRASVALAAGTYVVKGRHYRVAGTGTVETVKSQLAATAYLS